MWLHRINQKVWWITCLFFYISDDKFTDCYNYKFQHDFFQPCGWFLQKVFQSKGESLGFCYFWHYNFPESIIEIPQLFQKIWRFCSAILTISINFLDFLTFPYCKETNVSILQIASAFFNLQPTLNRLVNNCIKLCWY